MDNNKKLNNWTPVQLLDNDRLRDSFIKVESLFMNNGKFKLPSIELINESDWIDVRSWMHCRGVYLLPTLELVEWLKSKFGDETWNPSNPSKTTIEVGAGFGLLGSNLGITMTDSKVQLKNPYVNLWYNISHQPVIEYPDSVEDLDANELFKKYRPTTVIGSYITQGSNSPTECFRNGYSEYGIDLVRLFLGINRLILIQNLTILPHRSNKLIDLKKPVEFTWDEVPGLVTRSDPKYNRVMVWVN